MAYYNLQDKLKKKEQEDFQVPKVTPTQTSNKVASSVSQNDNGDTVATVSSGNKNYNITFSKPMQIGDTSTAAGMEAAIWNSTKPDSMERNNLYAQLDQAYRTPGSKYFRPYTVATNQGFIDDLASRGVDVSGGINDELFAKYAGYQQYLNTTDVSGGVSTSGKKKWTNDQWIAYDMYQLQKDEGTTKQVEAEWDSLQKELAYYAKKGLTNDEIKAKINWNNYKTLQKLDDSAKLGTPTLLNRATTYSQDSIDGVIWNARNGRNEDPFKAAIYYQMGSGATDNRNIVAKMRRTPGNAEYNPYVDGATNDKYRLMFDTSTWDMNWLRENQESIYQFGDDDQIKAYQKMWDIEATTEEAENELEVLQKRMASTKYDAEYYLSKLADGKTTTRQLAEAKVNSWLAGDELHKFNTLKKMDEERQKGSYLELSRSVNYRYEDIVNEVEEQIRRVTGINDKPAENVQKWKENVVPIGTAPNTGTENPLDNTAPIGTAPNTGTDNPLDNRVPLNQQKENFLRNRQKNPSFQPYFIEVQDNVSGKLPNAVRVAAGGNVQSDVSFEGGSRTHYTGTGSGLRFQSLDTENVYGTDDLYSTLGKIVRGEQLTAKEQDVATIFDQSLNWAFRATYAGGGLALADDAYERRSAALAAGKTAWGVVNSLNNEYASAQDLQDAYMQLFLDGNEAYKAGMSLEDYYKANDNERAELQEITNRVQKREASAKQAYLERQEADKQARMDHMLGLLNRYTSGETLTGDDANLLYALKPTTADQANTIFWDDDYLMTNVYSTGDPANPGIRELLSAENERRTAAGEDMIDYDEWEAVQEAVESYFAFDANMAKAAGMTTEEFYQKYPDMKRSVQDVWDEVTKKRERQNDPTTFTDEEKEGLGLWMTLGRGIGIGANTWWANNVGFFADIADMLEGEPFDVMQRSDNYQSYVADYGPTNARSQFRTDLNTYIASLRASGNKDKAAFYEKAIAEADANDLDIFSIPINFSKEELKDYHEQQLENVQNAWDYVNTHGTLGEIRAVSTLSSVTNSFIGSTVSAVFGGALGSQFAGTAIGFGLGSFDASYREFYKATGDKSAAALYGLVMAGVQTITEGEQLSKYYNFAGNSLSELVQSFMKDEYKKGGLKGLAGFLITLGSNAVEEVGQELGQNAIESAVNAIAYGDGSYLYDITDPEQIRQTVVSTLLSVGLNTTMSSGANAARNYFASGAVKTRLDSFYNDIRNRFSGEEQDADTDRVLNNEVSDDEFVETMDNGMDAPEQPVAEPPVAEQPNETTQEEPPAPVSKKTLNKPSQKTPTLIARVLGMTDEEVSQLYKDLNPSNAATEEQSAPAEQTSPVEEATAPVEQTTPSTSEPPELAELHKKVDALSEVHDNVVNDYERTQEYVRKLEDELHRLEETLPPKEERDYVQRSMVSRITKQLSGGRKELRSASKRVKESEANLKAAQTSYNEAKSASAPTEVKADPQAALKSRPESASAKPGPRKVYRKGTFAARVFAASKDDEITDILNEELSELGKADRKALNSLTDEELARLVAAVQARPENASLLVSMWVDTVESRNQQDQSESLLEEMEPVQDADTPPETVTTQPTATTEEQAAPTEEVTAPATEEQVVPVEEQAAPTEEAAAPAAEEQVTPAAEEQVVPVEEEQTVPAAEAPIPEETASAPAEGVAEEPTAPAAEVPAPEQAAPAQPQIAAIDENRVTETFNSVLKKFSDEVKAAVVQDKVARAMAGKLIRLQDAYETAKQQYANATDKNAEANARYVMDEAQNAVKNMVERIRERATAIKNKADSGIDFTKEFAYNAENLKELTTRIVSLQRNLFKQAGSKMLETMRQLAALIDRVHDIEHIIDGVDYSERLNNAQFVEAISTAPKEERKGLLQQFVTEITQAKDYLREKIQGDLETDGMIQTIYTNENVKKVLKDNKANKIFAEKIAAAGLENEETKAIERELEDMKNKQQKLDSDAADAKAQLDASSQACADALRNVKNNPTPAASKAVMDTARKVEADKQAVAKAEKAAQENKQANASREEELTEELDSKKKQIFNETRQQAAIEADVLVEKEADRALFETEPEGGRIIPSVIEPAPMEELTGDMQTGAPKTVSLEEALRSPESTKSRYDQAARAKKLTKALREDAEATAPSNYRLQGLQEYLNSEASDEMLGSIADLSDDDFKGLLQAISGVKRKEIPGAVEQYMSQWVNEDVVDDTITTESDISNPDTLPSVSAPLARTDQLTQRTETEQEQPNPGQGKRQFANETAQDSWLPDWLQDELRTNPELANYDLDSNRAQMERASRRINERGAWGALEDLQNKFDNGNGHFDKDDQATAIMLMLYAVHDHDNDLALTAAGMYDIMGTEAGQALQARKIFQKFSPIGARTNAARQGYRNNENFRRRNPRKYNQARDAAKRINERLRGLPSGGQSSSDNKWNVELNPYQQELIKQYHLENETRPGIFYNRATIRQRMLEAIIATPNVFSATNEGLSLADRLEMLDRGIPVVTNADLDYIGTQMGIFIGEGSFGGGDAAHTALARAYEANANITPSTLGEKFRTFRYVNMLLSVPTTLRNILGNFTQNAVNDVSHGIAAGLDAGMSLFTGKRTVGTLTAEQRIAGWKSFVHELANTYTDYFTDRAVAPQVEASQVAGEALDPANRFNTNSRNRTYQNSVLEARTTLENFLMSAGDRPVWAKHFRNSLDEQMNVEGNTVATQEQIERAIADANYSTFTEDNALATALNNFKRNAGAAGVVLDWLMPFTGVPSNIMRRMYQYSPLSLVSTGVKHAVSASRGTFDQRSFVTEMARGLTGTGMVALGIAAAQAGMIRFGTSDEDDDKKRGLRTANGEQYSMYIYNPFTNRYVSLSTFNPAVTPILLGTVIHDLFKDDPDIGNTILGAITAEVDSIIDASYLSGLQNVMTAYQQGGVGEAAVAMVGSGISSLTPATGAQIAAALDPYTRDTYDKSSIMKAINTGIINRIPMVRQMLLPEKVDITGQAVENYKKGLENLINPLTVSTARDDDAINELLRLSDALGDSAFLPSDSLSGKRDTVTGVARPLTGKEKEAYKKRYGTLAFDGGDTKDSNGNPVHVTGIRKLMASPAYADLSDEDKAKEVKAIVNAAKNGVIRETKDTIGETPKAEKTAKTSERTSVGARPGIMDKLTEASWLDLAYQTTLDGRFYPPTRQGSFSKNGVEYKIDDSFNDHYIDEINQRLLDLDIGDKNMDELAALMDSLYDKAYNATKTWYASEHPVE